MRDQFYKFMPIGLGLLLGWFLFSPPVWLRSLGAAAYLINGALVLLALLFFVALLLVANLPAQLKTEPIRDDQLPQDLRALAERYLRLGFVPAGPPLRVHVAPAALMVGFVHPKEPVYGTVFRTGTVPPKLSCDFVSILHGERGGLTTNADPAGAALPEHPGGLRQVFPGASVEELYRRHLAGLAYLKQRGIPSRAVSVDMFRQDLAMAIRKQREVVMASPLRGVLLTLWRSATKQVPFVGALREQRVAQRQIAKLLAG